MVDFPYQQVNSNTSVERYLVCFYGDMKPQFVAVSVTLAALTAATLSGCGFLPTGQASSSDQKQATVTATVTAEAPADKKAKKKESSKDDSDEEDEPAEVVTVTKEPAPTVTVIERVPSGGGGGYVYGPSRTCESGLGVNSTTSCPFARNVWQATIVSRGTSSTSAYSPVTGKWYNLRCSSNSTWLICRGGVNAEVFMRL